MTSTEPLPTPEAVALPPHPRRPGQPDVRHTADTPGASVQISSLRAIRSTGFAFAELQAEQATREADGNVAIIQPLGDRGLRKHCQWSL